MIINLRGTNGSGKSTIVQKLLTVARTKPRPIYGALGYRLPEAYEMDMSGHRLIYVLGPYDVVKIGGCDRMQFETVLTLLDKYTRKGHVVFEGVLISDHYGKVGAFLERFGRDAKVLFLDTPLDQCLANIRARTADAGTKNVEQKFKSIARVRQRMIEDDTLTVLDVSMKRGLSRIIELLEAA